MYAAKLTFRLKRAYGAYKAAWRLGIEDCDDSFTPGLSGGTKDAGAVPSPA